ncbi:MAG: pantoate--beta-alanine ligase [Verrucomicrobiia bacterium]
MRICKTRLRFYRECRDAARPLVLVPTMGALHEGHIALVRKARRRAGASGTVVATLFVNPKQFDVKEDLDRYPRPYAKDVAILRAQEVDLVFAPAASEMYAEDHSTWVVEDGLSQGYCGASRPGHFRGVTTVVMKLLQLARPDEAVFGAKDYQQLAVIRRMVRDLDVPVRIVAHPTVREADGLALSSRNIRLSKEERGVAPRFYQALRAVRDAIVAGPVTPREAEILFSRRLADVGCFKIDYFGVANPETLEPLPPTVPARPPLVLLGAVFLGETRLIDNLLLK